MEKDTASCFSSSLIAHNSVTPLLHDRMKSQMIFLNLIQPILSWAAMQKNTFYQITDPLETAVITLN